MTTVTTYPMAVPTTTNHAIAATTEEKTMSAARILGSLAVTTVVGVMALAGCSNSDLTVTGTIEVPGASQTNTAGEDCAYVSPGYDDIDLGTQVTVIDQSGDVVGLGQLDTATYTGPYPGTDSGGTCKFSFSVPNVAAGSDFYSIEVGNRGEVTFSEGDLADPVALVLG